MVSGVGCQQTDDRGQKTVCLLSAVICFLCAVLCIFLTPLFLIKKIDKINPCFANCLRDITIEPCEVNLTLDLSHKYTISIK
jgi:hypothetical protein